MKNISILGSTGSIGTQALEIIRMYKNNFSVKALAAGKNIELLAKQIIEFEPELVSISDEDNIDKLTDLLIDYKKEIEIISGNDGLIRVASYNNSNFVINAVVGMVGIKATIAAIKSKKELAIANKESLVCAGHIIMPLAKENGVNILPIDSEHSAIFQCIQGNVTNKINKLILTASGGPFLGYSKEDLKKVKLEDALKHPNWSMGKKITIDSSTMVNKGLEIIEAYHLFNIDSKKIQVLIQPTSIIHSMVEFEDGAVLAQMGVPDMKVPIAYTLFYPERKILDKNYLDFYTLNELTFLKPDFDVFDGLNLAYEAIEKGGSMPAAYNIANEIAVEQYLNNKIHYLDIVKKIKYGMNVHKFISNPSIDDIYNLLIELKSILE